jgi:hypothetical protein
VSGFGFIEPEWDMSDLSEEEIPDEVLWGDEDGRLPPVEGGDYTGGRPDPVLPPLYAGGVNLISHGSFESRGQWAIGPGWQVPYGVVDAPHGIGVARFVASGGPGSTLTSAPVAVDRTRSYWLEASVRLLDHARGVGRVILVERDESGGLLGERLVSEVAATEGWQRVGVCLTDVAVHDFPRMPLHPEVATLMVRFDVPGGSGFEWHIDAVGLTLGGLPTAFAPRPDEDIPGTAITPGSLPPSALDTSPPGVPTDLVVRSVAAVLPDGTSAVNLTLSLSHPSDPDYWACEVEATDRFTVVDEGDPDRDLPLWSDPRRVLMPADAQEATIANVLGNTRYWVRARSLDQTGNRSAWSATLRTLSVGDLDAPPVPQGLTAVPGFRLAGIAWSPAGVADLAYYEVRWRIATTGDDHASVRIRSTSIVITDLEPESEYAFEVRAVDRSGNVQRSATDPRPVSAAVEPEAGWSDPVLVTPTLVGERDVAYDSIIANHIRAGAVTADKLGAGYIRVNTTAEHVPDGIEVVDGTGALLGRWDEAGLIVFEEAGDPLRHVRVSGGAVKVTTDGGDEVSPAGTYEAAITPDGINASRITFGQAPGGHNLIRNSSFELNDFSQPVSTAAFDSNVTTPGWNATYRVGTNDNVTEGTSLTMQTSAY